MRECDDFLDTVLSLEEEDEEAESARLEFDRASCLEFDMASSLKFDRALRLEFDRVSCVNLLHAGATVTLAV